MNEEKSRGTADTDDVKGAGVLPPAGPGPRADDEEAPARGRHPKWLTPAIAGGAAVALLAAGGTGVAVWRHHVETERQAALAACRIQLSDLDEAYRLLDETLNGQDVTEAQKITAGQVADPATVDALTHTVGRAKTRDTSPTCDETADRTTLDAAAANAKTLAVEAGTRRSELADATAKLVASRDEKTLTDARNALESLKTEAQQLYDTTDGKVQDDTTRDTLKNTIDTANADTVDDANKSTEQIRSAMDAVSQSKTAKEEADRQAAEAKAKTEAAEAAKTRKKSSSTGTSSSAKKNTNGNAKKNTGNSTTKKNTGNSSSGSSNSGNESGWDGKAWGGAFGTGEVGRGTGVCPESACGVA